MLRIIGKTFATALAGLCLVSTLALAQNMPSAPGQTMVCSKIDAQGYCIEAKSQDDKVVTVRVEGLKVSEKMTCVTKGTDTTCTKITITN